MPDPEIRVGISVDTTQADAKLRSASDDAAAFSARIKTAQDAYNAAAKQGVEVQTALTKAFADSSASGASW